MVRTRTRLSADERRAEVVEAAIRAFAQGGLNGTSTEAIARDAGISHAYLFRLFPTKKELFLACSERCCGRVRATFRSAAERYAAGADPDAEDVLDAMGSAYVEMLADRELLRAQMQFWVVASMDPEVRAVAQRQYGEVMHEIERLSGADADTVREFVARGMLMNVAAALSLDEIADRDWVRRLIPHLDPEAPTS